jgi:hypothetical protein
MLTDSLVNKYLPDATVEILPTKVLNPKKFALLAASVPQVTDYKAEKAPAATRVRGNRIAVIRQIGCRFSSEDAQMQRAGR